MPPNVVILQPAYGQVLLPRNLPINLVCAASDDDAAVGGIVHERIMIDSCVAYDRWSYGDGDGLLEDEVIELSADELCRIASLCGFNVLTQPIIRAEAFDCGGNIGFATRQLAGSLMPNPGICGR